MACCDMLALKHSHERDAHILFDEGPHIYTIDGDSNYMSVITWNTSTSSSSMRMRLLPR